MMPAIHWRQRFICDTHPDVSTGLFSFPALDLNPPLNVFVPPSLYSLCTIIIFVANVQIATAVDRAPNVIRMSLKDSEFFVKDTYRHISTNLHHRVHAISDGITGDLAEIDKLLGEPIQEELADSTQIESIFEHILNISTG